MSPTPPIPNHKPKATSTPQTVSGRSIEPRQSPCKTLKIQQHSKTFKLLCKCRNRFAPVASWSISSARLSHLTYPKHTQNPRNKTIADSRCTRFRIFTVLLSMGQDGAILGHPCQSGPTRVRNSWAHKLQFSCRVVT